MGLQTACPSRTKQSFLSDTSLSHSILWWYKSETVGTRVGRAAGKWADTKWEGSVTASRSSTSQTPWQRDISHTSKFKISVCYRLGHLRFETLGKNIKYQDIQIQDAISPPHPNGHHTMRSVCDGASTNADTPSKPATGPESEQQAHRLFKGPGEASFHRATGVLGSVPCPRGAVGSS